MLDVVESHIVGSTRVRATVTGDVASIGARLRAGDPTLGWDGDPTLTLHLAVECDVFGEPLRGGRHIYEVWGIDEQGQPYLALQWPRCDASLIQRLVSIDSRRSNVLDRVVAANAAAERNRDNRLRDLRAEANDKLHFGLMKDLGHLYGQRHRLYTTS